jgi:glycosyltransferase involved in cell wall biosynthesis
VDNNSDPPVNARFVHGALPGIRVQIVRDARQGLVYARESGIRASAAPLIVFLDDDNHLDPDYLERALSIASRQPHLGAFGGRTSGVFERDLPTWKRQLLAYLGVRDYGSEPITSSSDEWGEWEPIGAGMVCRRDVAERFVEWVQLRSYASRLGRSGSALMSGEDSLIAHAAYSLGYSCSYQPELNLQHWMKPERLNCRTLARTMAGHGRSHVLLRLAKGQRIRKPRFRHLAPAMWTRYAQRVRQRGFSAGTIEAFWDFGYFSEARRSGS